MTLEQYLLETRGHPLLTPDRKLEVARAARDGDSDSRDLLINSHLRLVVSIAKRYSRNGILDELIGEGNLALTDAAEKYDPERGVRFNSYAFAAIERRIWAYLDGQGLIKLSPTQKKLMRSIYKISTGYLITNGEEPTSQHVADELNMQQTKKRYTGNDIRKLLQMYEDISVLSLNGPVGDDGDSEMMDFVTRDDGRKMVEAIADKSIADKVRVIISELAINPTDRGIVESVLYENKGFDELADSLNLRREQVRQRYSRGLRSLKSSLADSGILKRN
jgi:RNA polymerase nonessential primary-like sigma factor